jgi:amino acid transporter
MAAGVKRILLGRALSTYKAEHQLLPKILALPVFSSDPLSSVAYATEEMMLVLAIAGAGALSLMLPIGFGIAALLAIVVTSYRQTVRAYPRGGGSYIVSRENLGTVPGLVAAGAILTDYVLTVSVSVTAGAIAVSSAFPALAEHRVALALSFIALVTLANLRGVREAGILFAVPTYGFAAMVGVTIVVGLIQCLGTCRVAESADDHLAVAGHLTVFLVLRAFSSGATALTGVEAIADGVQAFRRPQARNAATTLAIMGTMAITMFLGITFLARELGVRVNPASEDHQSVLAQIGETVFHGGLLFYVLQVFTAGILILAANTAFQDFPRLSAILARDRFMPSQFRNRGDRLVFSNGVLVLAAIAGLLVYIFDANLTRLIQLYVVGVFTAFTLSQSGMVRRWMTLRTEGWRRSAVINGVGAATTGVVLVIVTLTKFTRGAWIVICTIPVLVAFFLFVHRHYSEVGRLLRARGLTPAVEASNTFVVLVRDLGPATAEAVRYLRALRPERLIPLYVGDPARFEQVSMAWPDLAPRFGRLELLANAEAHLTRSVRAYVRGIDRGPDDFVTVVLPELLRRRAGWWQYAGLRRALWFKARLFFEPGLVLTDIPTLAEAEQQVPGRLERPVEPERIVVLVPVSAVHDASIRALVYAKSLRPSALSALFFSTDPGDVEPIVEDWSRNRVDIPLAIVDASFRDIGDPLLTEVRRLTGRGDTMVNVILPEFVVERWWEQFLHNQSGLYIKRLLLFEPRVVVTSVPYHLHEADVATRARQTERRA